MANRIPRLPYRPRNPENYRPGIGLIGCGAITVEHLTAYRQAGYRVVALCDIDGSRAESRREEFYPDADVYSDFVDLLDRDDVAVVDITTHPRERPPLIEAALSAGKHVLSQKPFVLDLDEGQRLVRHAEACGVQLAVNQNGRWAPHFGYLRAAVAAGLLGQLASAHFRVHWNHGWVRGTPFEDIEHLILYDFAIHWFDMAACLFRDRAPRLVFASTARTSSQEIDPPLLAQAVIEYDGAQASLIFDADTHYGPLDATYVTGSEGVFQSSGKDLDSQKVALCTKDVTRRPRLEGKWFPGGFHGAMGELLCAIEEGRTPSHSAKDNLQSLALCFAAVASAQRSQPVLPGTVRRLPGDG